MDATSVLAALSVELSDLAANLARLQDVPLLQSEEGTPLEGEGLLRAMVALQDLDRLTQTAVALAEFARKVASADGVTDPPHMTQIVAEMPLRSVADRLGASLGLTPELLVGVH